jgi:hypothetical protein
MTFDETMRCFLLETKHHVETAAAWINEVTYTTDVDVASERCNKALTEMRVVLRAIEDIMQCPFDKE